ncbi:MAG TPA: methionyl-tRNA formyltransferase [Casimicrobiaceae bacterium]|nr:methionyl-tRNA formyltransferase [Casimicrobiaceae bacterium]
MNGIRAGFAGTPEFAATALEALVDAGVTIPLVLTQPDRPQGRGLATAASPVKRLAQHHGLALAQPATLRDAHAQAAIAAARLDVLVVAAYGLILPQAVLDAPRHGCLNIHASLLPRWRGAAPVARAIEAGDAATGVTIMQMDAGLDTGAMIETRRMAIDARDTAGSLTAKLAAEGARAMVDVLTRLARDGRLAATPQPAAGITYAHKIARDGARVDWTRDADAIDRAVRAFDPWPAAWTTLGGTAVKIRQARALPEMAPTGMAPGTIVRMHAAGIDVACARGVLRIEALQPANARQMTAAAFVAGRAIAPGARLD